jgi:hypothetical protein
MVAFGRLPEFDELSRNYPIRALLGAHVPPVTKIWACDQFLDQGQEGACVGFAWTHELVADPEMVPNLDATFARQIYYRAQQLDQWPGEDYSGTSVLAGAKATVESGWLVEYRWAFTLDDVLETLAFVGPVIFGLDWYAGMMNPDVDGIIHPTGSVVGGHAILGRGVDVDAEVVMLHNSWGPDWGRGGTCLLPWEDLEMLLATGGECSVPLVRTQVEPVEPVPPEPEPIPPEPEPVPPEPEPEDGCLPGGRHAARVRAWWDHNFSSKYIPR